MRILLVVFALAMTACARTSPIIAPDGKEAFAITCNGIGSSWSPCYEQAGNVCGRSGYSIIDRAESATADAVSRSMVIRCKS